MEQQHDSTGDPAKPVAMKRTARMLHESSFATSAFTSSRSQSRPPGFIASSLDYKSSATDPGITTKPGRDKKNNSKKQQQEQAERERQYQQQRQYRSGHPTRAQGNFGPPPHSVRSLEDLENMTEEQIYKLFMDDPELHQTFIKATAKEQNGNTVPTSAPVGAQNAHSSSRRKTSSSKSKRSNASTKSLKQDDAEREVPYFQWLFLLFLFCAALYKIRKAFSSPTSTKELRNRAGKKQKKKQGGTGKKSSTKKLNVQEKPKTNLHREEPKFVEKKPPPSPPRKKKRKKPPKKRSTTPSSSNSNEENESTPTQKQERQNEPDMESTDASSGNTELEITTIDPAVQAESDMAATVATSANDDEWQTVTKSSKGDKQPKATQSKKPILEKTISEPSVAEKKILEEPVAEKKILEELVADKDGESDIVVEPKKEINKQPSEVSDSTPKKIEKPVASEFQKVKDTTLESDQAETAETISVAKEEKKGSDVKNVEKPQVATKGEPVTTTDDDAALALQLHNQEVNLARAVIANPQEEEWAEVTVKKKKGSKV
mmetsp:Transcript_7172/g.17515  ORF Transcript_7172/g.17515 Transcript_7172/m.17515 type:complete len:546 (+) Transcript_7172:14-1651(+)